MIDIYKHIHIYDPLTMHTKFVPRKSPNKRHNFQILSKFSGDSMQGANTKSFYYCCIATWNNLPNDCD